MSNASILSNPLTVEELNNIIDHTWPCWSHQNIQRMIPYYSFLYSFELLFNKINILKLFSFCVIIQKMTTLSCTTTASLMRCFELIYATKIGLLCYRKQRSSNVKKKFYLSAASQQLVWLVYLIILPLVDFGTCSCYFLSLD